MNALDWLLLTTLAALLLASAIERRPNAPRLRKYCETSKGPS